MLKRKPKRKPVVKRGTMVKLKADLYINHTPLELLVIILGKIKSIDGEEYYIVEDIFNRVMIFSVNNFCENGIYGVNHEI